MSTLICRLAGPVQSWGEHARFTTRPTLQVPTLSGLTGLARAALGHGRDGDPGDVAWLRNLTMAVRIDSIGVPLNDYHLVSPRSPVLPPGHRHAKKENSTLATVRTGNGTAWTPKGKGVATAMITKRAYRSDAVYLWLIEGPDEDLQRLRHALDNPHWHVSLGRKACVPDWLFVLGISPHGLLTTAGQVPLIDAHASPVDAETGDEPDPAADAPEPAAPTRELHLLTGTPTEPLPDSPTRTETFVDRPAGTHPHHGYLPNTRRILRIPVPTVPTRGDLLDWSRGLLTTGAPS